MPSTSNGRRSASGAAPRGEPWAPRREAAGAGPGQDDEAARARRAMRAMLLMTEIGLAGLKRVETRDCAPAEF